MKATDDTASFMLFQPAWLCYITYTMKRFVRIVFPIIFLAVFVACFPSPAAGRETNVTVTFVAGGAVCGVYFFIFFTMGHESDWRRTRIATDALITYDTKGWNLGCPRVKFITDEKERFTPYMEIISFQF